MKIAGATLFLLGAALASAAAADSASSARPRDDAARRLGLTFATPLASAAVAPAADNSEPAIVLPKFDVREGRIEIEPHRLLTAKGRLADAKQRELSPLYQKTFGPVAAVAALYFNPLSLLQGVRANDAEAMVLYEQDERLRRLREADTLLDLVKDTDPAAYRELRAATRTSFQLRSPGIGEH